jgi:Winged helix DNA-binding domain
MRATIHMVSRHDYPLFAAGVRDARRAWWLGLTRRRLDARTLLAKARRVRSLLAHGPLSRTEIMERSTSPY